MPIARPFVPALILLSILSANRADAQATSRHQPASTAASPLIPETAASPPAPAIAAGFTNLVFDDEFTTPSTISPNGSGSYNWYATNFAGASASLPSSDYSVQGGYLAIKTDTSGYSYGLATAAPGHTAQAWQHGYFEASIKFNPGGYQGSAWPAFWSWSIEDATGTDVGNGTRGPYAELDFMEAYPIGYGRIAIGTTIHQWLSGKSVSQNSNNAPSIPWGTNFNQFHVYGCAWTPDKVVYYFDNQPVTTVLTGPGTPFTAIEQDHMFIILGAGRNWPMDVDYVHIWQ
jgi:beta-glucanase (GH16 family)